MDISGSLPKTETGNTVIVEMTNKKLKWTWAIPTEEATATDVARISVKDGVIPYGILSLLLTFSGPQFVGIISNAACMRLSSKLPTTPAYHFQTSGQTKQ